MAKNNDTRPQKFCKLAAQGLPAYQAAIKAGYSEKYAKNYSHQLLEKYGNKIEMLKPKVQEILEQKFKYDVEASFKKLNEIQELALLQNKDGDYSNLTAAIKAEELKGKMYGVYEADNRQKSVVPIIIDDI